MKQYSEKDALSWTFEVCVTPKRTTATRPACFCSKKHDWWV